MALLIPFEPGGLDAKIVNALDDIIAAIQTWAGKVDGINQQGLTTDVQVGVIQPYGGTTAPTGYLMCDGTAYNRVTYSALFDVIGTAFGAGDGSTTFNVPDLRQRFPLGKAASGTGSTLGSTGGAIDHAHTGPSHTHSGPSHTHDAGTLITDVANGTQIGNYINDTLGGRLFNVVGSTTAAGTGDTGAAGTGNTGTANPPFQAVNFIIKT